MGTMAGLGVVSDTVKQRKRPLSRVCIGAVVAMGWLGLAMPATAAVCATSSVGASGQPGYFQFVAARQARDAWTRKVERDQRLGRSYSRWSAAHEAKLPAGRLRAATDVSRSPTRAGAATGAPPTPRGEVLHDD